MRLPIVPQLSTKDGVANKNARLTNALREKNKAVVRPGLSLVLDYAGAGNGLVPWNDRLIGLFDDTVYDMDGWGSGAVDGTGGTNFALAGASGTPSSLTYSAWSSGYTYPNGAGVTYGGTTWYSIGDGNIGQTPDVDSAWWVSTWFNGTWAPETTYDIGDTVTANGTTYYSMSDGNVGNPPLGGGLGNGHWSTSAPTASRWHAKWKSSSAYSANCASFAAAGAAAYSDRLAIDYASCLAAWADAPAGPVEVAWTIYTSSNATQMLGRQYNDTSRLFSDPECTLTHISVGAITQYGTVEQTV